MMKKVELKERIIKKLETKMKMNHSIEEGHGYEQGGQKQKRSTNTKKTAGYMSQEHD